MSEDFKTVALVVDDLVPNRKLLNSLLTREGYSVVEAGSGEEAIEQVIQQQIDIIFMDVMMPGIGGYEATSRIKALTTARFIPIILVTALDEHQGMVTGIEAGADDYITKPIDAILLRAKVSALERIRQLYEVQQRQNIELREIQARIANEQRLAENIMNTAISQRKDELENVSSVVEPAEVFSGDLVLQAKVKDNAWMVMICDFTGHGLPAAVGTVPVTETFYAMAAKNLPPESILNEINFKLKHFLPTNMFMGCILFFYSASDHMLKIWNGGMPSVLLKTASSGEGLQKFDSTDLPLGIIDKTQQEFLMQEVSLQQGDVVIAYSDGLIEAENDAGEQLGLQRLESIISTNHSAGIINDILAAWKGFQAASRQLDDVTLVTLNV